MTDAPRTAAEWDALILDAVETPDPALSNFKVTRIHHLLALALRDAVGAEAGSNFHHWAVWGSRKAGVTIRQEDRDQASRDATVVAGVVGGLVGVAVGWLLASAAGWPLLASVAGWTLAGVATGGYCGYLLAGYTRNSASRLILEGNRTVLDDIGRMTARYLEYVRKAAEEGGDPDGPFRAFLSRFREGPTDRGGQDMLRKAFERYESARLSRDPKVRHECNYHANCLAVLHEHIRLQPYISKSLPFLIRKCVTRRLMTYSVGGRLLAVHEDVPPLDGAAFPPTLEAIDGPELREFLHGPEGWDTGRGTLRDTRARDWTKIRERMGYVVNLFRSRHLDAEVQASPYTPAQLGEIAAGRLPGRPW